MSLDSSHEGYHQMNVVESTPKVYALYNTYKVLGGEGN